MNKCMGVPVIMSFPHLMWADDAYRNTIEDDRNVVNDTYNTIIDFEPHLGIPLRGAIRLQFNMVLRPITISGAVFPMTANWPKALFPIVWLEDSFQLTDELVEEMDSKLFDKLLIADAVQWTLVAVGAALSVLAIILLITCRQKQKLSL
ncbi:hypothetical protein RI129_010589 [Pyrocoelia pectoralis]|uniref:Sensory neuron membrane protein 2 n=1 Tax=Pyrocoelia pectoralis TaxID=417401 RepID=A0AAN7V3K6_9COLE